VAGAAAVVTTTAGIRDSFAEAYGARPRVHVVPNGCDPPESAFTGLPAGEPEILYAGQLYPWKGVDVLVEAFAQVPRGRLVILGGIEGEADTARVRALVERLGLRGRVEMPGSCPRRAWRRRFSAPPWSRSRSAHGHDGAPHLALKAFEAMAAGRTSWLRPAVHARGAAPRPDACWCRRAIPRLWPRVLRASWTIAAGGVAGAGRTRRAPAYGWPARGPGPGRRVVGGP
jgi:glycosyltransferase involved in cell wall biosynthesis